MVQPPPVKKQPISAYFISINQENAIQTTMRVHDCAWFVGEAQGREFSFLLLSIHIPVG